MKKVTTCFLIKGRNLGNFINLLKNRGILLLNVKILSQNELTFCVNECDAEKIFAIGNELCYNIRVIREWGLLYPVLFLKRNLGILIGSLIFIIMVLFSNNYIFEISYSGSGNAYKNQVKNYLDGQGVKQFTKFSSIDLSKLSKDILSTNENLSFVSCQKRGNVLKIELVASDKAGDSLTGKEKSLVADADGVIEDIKVYRGTAKKIKGDKVLNGEEIVSGIITTGDEQFSTNVIASVTLISKKQMTYLSSLDNDEVNAEIFAVENFSNREIIKTEISKTFDGEKYLYKVLCYYRHTICKG